MQVTIQCINWYRLGDLFRASFVEILKRWSHHAPVFSWLARKISAIKPLPLKLDTL